MAAAAVGEAGSEPEKFNADLGDVEVSEEPVHEEPAQESEVESEAAEEEVHAASPEPEAEAPAPEEEEEQQEEPAHENGKAGTELEDLVNLLEFTPASKIQETFAAEAEASNANVPTVRLEEVVAEIPDEASE